MNNLPIYGADSSQGMSYSSLPSMKNGNGSRQSASAAMRNELIQSEYLMQSSQNGHAMAKMYAANNMPYLSCSHIQNHPIASTPYNLDRISNGMGHLNCQNSLQDSLFMNSNYNYQSSMNLMSQNAKEPIMRREHEIDRLKMRIILLEQQLGGSSMKSNMSSECALSKLSYESSLIRNDVANYSAKDDQLLKLDRLLNEKEYEIQEMSKKSREEMHKLELELSKYKTTLNSREEETASEKSKFAALQKENDKLHSRLNECNEYIMKLPTVDEIKETEKKMNEIRGENDTLKSKISEFEKKILKAKQFIKEKNSEMKSLQEKVEKAEQEKEKIKTEFASYKKVTQQVGELMKQCEENEIVKAELECAKNMLLSLQDKLECEQAKYEKELSAAREEKRLEVDVNNSLRIELENKEISLRNIEKSTKDISEKNQNLMNENLNLSERIKMCEKMMSSEVLKSLQNFFKELNCCTMDLNEVVNNCIDVYNGKPVDVGSLLGYSNERSYRNAELDGREYSNGLVNSEFLLKKTGEIKKLREKISEVRKMVSNAYAEKVGDNISCITQ